MHISRDDKTRMYLYRAELFDKDRGCVKYSFSPQDSNAEEYLIDIKLCRVECVYRSLLSIIIVIIYQFPMQCVNRSAKERRRILDRKKISLTSSA